MYFFLTTISFMLVFKSIFFAEISCTTGPWIIDYGFKAFVYAHVLELKCYNFLFVNYKNCENIWRLHRFYQSLLFITNWFCFSFPKKEKFASKLLLLSHKLTHSFEPKL